jgi:glycosyltransferase involved in cell wall biosynthesis
MITGQNQYKTQNKKTIVHVIETLGRGGAETMLFSLLPELRNYYNIVLITLNEVNEFPELPCTHYCLHYKGLKSLPSAVMQLKKIIKQHKPVLVRSQLFWSTIIARLSLPPKTPFVFSIHSVLSIDAFSKNRLSLFLEKLTYKKQHTLISVSTIALEDYKQCINVTGKTFVLHNFVDPAFFDAQYIPVFKDDHLKLVTVGNLKEAKNFEFLLHVIERLKGKVNLTLDIYGEGHLRAKLESIIQIKKLPVRLLGKSSRLYEVLPQYDAFIMSSLYEGFGIAPAEAMAIGLPLILNDLPVFKEMSFGNAIFYESNNIEKAANAIVGLQKDFSLLLKISENGKKLAGEHYSRDAYLQKLLKIYNEVELQ